MAFNEEVNRLCEAAFNAMSRNDFPTACQTFEKALLIEPNEALAWNNRGLCLLNLNHPFDAVMNIDKAIAVNPKEAAYYCNKGAALYELNLLDEALSCYDTAVTLNPEFPEAWNNIGNTKKYQGKLPEAIAAYKKAVESNPDYVDARLHLSFAQLMNGEFEEGWKEFEWRWKSPQLPPRGLKMPQWNGESLAGKTILVYGEQGFGDSLQFMRYAPLIKKLYSDATVYLEVRLPLKRLMETIKDIDKVFALGEKLPGGIDYVIPCMSLPRIFGTTIDNIPWNGPYFHIDEHDSSRWISSLDRLPKGVKVGLCWAGMSRDGNPLAQLVDQKRSTSLQMFAPAAKIPGISWVSLQKGPSTDQLKQCPAGMVIGDFTEEFYDFYDTGSMIQNLDLVIGVDTAVIHLAAALGKPTWMLNRWSGCWRWLQDKTDTPWYPSMRIFNQPAPGAWGPVIEEVAVALRQFVQRA